MGNLVSSKGLKPDPKKVEGIIDMWTPTDIPSLQRLLGMINYLAQYIPNECTITAPLRALFKKEVEWNWTCKHDSAMNKLREPVLAYNYVTKPVTIQAHASQSGLGACLLQDRNSIAYAKDFGRRKLRANRKKKCLRQASPPRISPVYLWQAGHSRPN